MKSQLDLAAKPVRYSTWSLLKDLAALIRPYQLQFWGATFLRLIGDLVWLYPPIALAAIVTFLTTYTPGTSLIPMWVAFLLWGGAVVVRSTSIFFAKTFGNQLAERVALDATLKTIGHMSLLDMAWHEQENTGNKLKRIHNASNGLNRIGRIWFNNLIEIAVNFIGITIIISHTDKIVVIIFVLFIVTFFPLSFWISYRGGKAGYAVGVQEEKVDGLTFEAVNNIRTIKVMAMAPAVYAMITATTHDLFQKIKIRISRFQLGSFLSIWGHACKFGGFFVIIFGIVNGHYEVGFLILFNLYFDRAWQSVNELSDVTQELMTAKLSMGRMKTILNEPIVIDSTAGKVSMPEDWQKITVKNLSFSYGNHQVLDDVSFEINRGERIGIVGLSGAGKSTLFKLLLKEREGFTGDILFDDVSITNIRRSDYFTHVSAVLQDTEVFNFSLKDNVTITNPGQKVNPTLLEQALTIAHVKDFLAKLPQGLDTLIGEKGIKLSGGERQRLGIARAIFRQPELLLLDEATSHLDLESEEKIQDSLHTFFTKVTAVVIAHRLTTIKEMDKILVMEEGKIIESGNFDELYKKQGRFYELWEKQNL